jgi:hypothetical protein
MAITALEIEKFRRETERDTLILRLKNVNTRLQTVESEKAALLRRLGRQGRAKPARQPLESSRPAGHVTPVRIVPTFKFQY